MKKISQSEAAILRQKAEEMLRKKMTETDPKLSDTDIHKLLHELEVHQIELELQNEELILAKAAAQHAAEKSGELYNLAPSGYFTLSKEGEIIELNLCSANMLGKERSRLKNSLFGFFVSDDTKPIFNLFLEKLFLDKTKQVCDVSLLADKHLPIHVHLSGIITKNGDQCLVSVVDITDYVKTGEALKESKSLYHSFIEQLPNAVFRKDREGRFILVNSQFCKLKGLTKEGLIGSKPMEVVANGMVIQGEQDHAIIYASLGEDTHELILQTGKTFEKEEEYFTADGGKRYMHVVRMPVVDSYGNIIGSQGIMFDITQRKQMEEKLHYVARLYVLLDMINQTIVRTRDQDELFRTICQVAIEFGQFRMAWIGLTDKANNTLQPVVHAGMEDGYLNQVLISTGDVPEGKGPSGIAYSSGEIVICNDIAIDPLMIPWREEALKRGYRSSVAVPFMRRGKVFGTLNLYATETDFFSDDEQKLLQAIGADISFALDAMDSETERILSELKLQERNKEILIQNEELLIAKEHAEESDRLKTAFLANMSHEIRTPMNGILGFAELLKQPKLTGEEQQEYIGIIEKSGERMLNIINDLITFAKVESGQMKTSISETNINDQIEYIYNLFKPEVEYKGMQLYVKKSLPSEEAIIKTDRDKVFAILTNLVKNAIKYSDYGNIEFGYNFDSADLPAELEFFVKDTGIGIPTDRQEAIFDRFIQADIGDTRAYQGAGLGLSISKAYVEMLGGKIWVKSEEGKGSVFYFTIPCNGEPEEENDIENTVLAHNAENKMNPEVSGLKILIAEDDDGSAMLITVAVRCFGKEIIKVRTGVAAVETCRNNPDIDLVLMDIKMPIIDGYEATRQIRQFNTDVIIIAQTAYALIGDREKAIAVGCNDYISKPFGKASLTKLIKKHCCK